MTRISLPFHCRESQLLSRFKRSSLSVCIGMVLAGQVYAGPEGGEVVGGAGAINRSGNTTTINQTTDRMAIDWQSYDVGSNERVHYVQPDSSSVSLNRILSNTGSNIQGRIDANGQVILVNPHGIMFGKDSVVNAGGILASGLNIDASDFMNGDFTFSAIEGMDGVVINAGTLNAATGGSVSLIGQQVTNEGLISAQLGRVTFAAGREAVVTFEASGMVGVRITESLLEDGIGVDAAVINAGQVLAEDGQILLTASTSRDVFSQAVNAGELDTAYSVVVDDDGTFTLGGGANVVNAGVLSASGDAGGTVVLLGENVTNSGEIHVDSYDSGVAGMVEVHSVDTTMLIENSVITANADQGEGGDIKLLGERVGLVEQSSVSANGSTAGGQVLVGGDNRGENPRIRNASRVYAGIDTGIAANATEDGDGGKVILWGDDRLTALGYLAARGAEYGSGGFVETSSGVVNLNPEIDVSSESGEGGTWLIDPYNVTIQEVGSTNMEVDTSNIDYESIFSPASDPDDVADASNSILTTLSIRSALVQNGGSRVLVETTGDGEDDEGNITVSSRLNYDGTGNGSLTLRAHNDIIINGNIEDVSDLGSDSLNLTLEANSDLTGGGDITIANDITIATEGGNFTATGSNFTSTGATINVSSDLRTINQGEANERQLIGNIDIDIDGDALIGNVVIGDTRTSGEPADSATTSLFDVDATNIIRNGSTNYGVDDNVANHTVNLTYTATGDISFIGATADNTGSGNDILNVTLNADSDAGEDSDEGNDDDGVITIDGNTSLWLTGGAFLASGHDFILGSATTEELIGTEGGTFDVGTSLAPLSGDFNSNFDNTLIITNFGTGPAGNISIHADGDVDLGGLDNHTHSNRDVAAWNSASSTNFTLSVNAGDDLSLNQNFDFGRLVGTGTGNTLTFNAGNSVPSGGGDSGIRVNATLFSSGSDYSNITFGVVGNDTNLTNFTNSAVINSNGGSVNLFVDGAISVESNISTNGGNFTVGDTTGSVFSTSFDNYVDDTGGTISTSMDDGAGDITITTVLGSGTNGDVTLGALSVDDDDFVSFSQGGNIRVSSGNNIRFESDYNFNSTGGTTTDRVLELRAHGHVTVNGSIFDSVASHYDTLNVSLLANDNTGGFATGIGAVNVNSNIYTGGGNFVATGASFDSGGVLIDTDNSNSFGGSTSTNGGNATITTSGAVTLGSIQTDTSTDSTGNFTVAGSSISNVSGAVINVAGTPTFTGASGNLSIDLSNDGHSFGNTIAIGSDQATLALGDINIDTGGTAVNIDATTISQLTDTDAITLNGALLQINADSIQTQDIDTSGAANSVGGGVTVTALNGTLSLGTVTTNGGTVGDNVVGQNAGAVTLAATSDISVGEIQAVGSDGHDDENNGTDQYNGGAGANITITSSGGGAITLAGASSDGGNGHAQQNQNDDDASGGDAGYIYVNTAGQLNLGGDITARGGRLWDNDRSESRNGTTNLHAVSRAGITLTGSSIILTDNIRVDATLTPEFFDPDDSERSSNHVEDARSPNIIFSGTIDGTTPGEESLNVYGADITFSQNLGAATRLGAVTIGEADTFITNAIGPLAASVNVGTRTINAASLSVTASDFVSSDINTVGLTGLVGGQIVIDVETTLTTGSLTTTGGTANTSGTDQNGKAGGRIDLDAADIIVGAINASGSNANSGVGGDAGSVTIDATENNGTPTIQINGDIATEGGNGTTVGSARQSQLTLAGSNVTSASVFLNFSSTTNFLTSSVNITGTSSNFDTLTGPSTNAFWVSDENNGGAINNAATPTTVIDFSGFEILKGGSGADDFTLSDDFTSVSGGDGLDVFRVTTDINTRLFGEGDVDTFHLNGGVTDSDGDTRDVNGGGGNDIFNVAGNITVTIEGDGGSADVVTLVDTSDQHSWSVLTDNSGTLNSNIDFQTVERLNGANGDADGGDDQFTFSNSFSGPFGGSENSINARGGDNDSVLVTNATNPIPVTLGENLFGVVSAETIASNGANNGAAFTLQLNSDATAAGSTTTWTINGVNDGTIDNSVDPVINFENFASLEGNQANDSFEVQTGASIVSVSGIREDGSLQTNESNALSFADGANIWTISGQHAGNVTGDHATSFTQVQSVTGAGSDTLNALDQNNTWNIGTTNTVALTVTTGSPTDTLTFSGMNTLNGGSEEDTFNVNATVDWLLNGAEGDDLFVFGTGGAVLGAGSGIDGGVAGSEGDRLIARDAANNWAIRAIDDSDTNTVADSTNVVYVRDFKNIDVLEGSDTNADIYDFAIVSNNTIIDAGTSTGDIADYADVTGNVLVTVSDTAVSGIDQFIGNNDGRTATTNNTTLTFASGSGDSVAWRIFDDAAITDADGINDGDINGTVAFLNVNNLTGGEGNDTFTFDQTTNSISGLSGTITGGGNSGSLGDRIVARNENINWVVAPLSGSESLTYENGLDDGGVPPVALESTTTFTGIETLDSGTGNDTFTVGQLVTVTLNAGAGTDTIALPDEDLPITLGDPVGGLTLNGFEQIDAIEGRNNSLTVTSGENVEVDWQITSANSGTVAVGNASATTFTHFQILNGGEGDDTFDFSGGGSVARLSTANGEVNGNGGDNTVIGQAVATTWSIDGVASGSVTNTGSSVVYVEHFSGVNALQGQSTVDRFTLTAAGSFFGTINGVGGADTLTINSVAGERNEWRLLDDSIPVPAPDQVRRLNLGNAASSDIDFSNIAALTGGTGVDEFIFLSGGSFGGTIDALDSASIVDVVDRSSVSTPISVALGSTSINGVENAERVIGNGNNSTLTGLNSGTNTWRVSVNDTLAQPIPGADGQNDGTLTNGSNSIQFINFANLTGGDDAIDNFTLESSGSVTGTMTGGTPSTGTIVDTLTTSTDNSLWVLTAANTGNVNSNNFSEIERIVANGASDTLRGINQNNLWTINDINMGTVAESDGANPLTFEGMENLSGHQGNDVFVLVDNITGDDGQITGTIEGTDTAFSDVSGVDELTVQSASGTQIVWTLDQNVGGDVTGSVASRVNQSTLIERFNGGEGNDRFDINDADVVARVDGNGSSNDTVRLAYDEAASWDVGSATEFDTVAVTLRGTVTLLNIETAEGSNVGRDDFFVNGVASDLSELRGRGGDDVFTVVTTGAVRLTIDGGDTNDTDTLIGANRTNDWVIDTSTATDANTLNWDGPGTTGIDFTDVENFTGGTGADTFEVRSVGIVNTLRGSDVGEADTSTDQLHINASSGITTWNITAENTGNVEDGFITSFVGIESLLGSGRQDIFDFETATAHITGLIDGASASNDQLDIQSLTAGVVIEIGETVTPTNPNTNLPNLHINNIETLTAAADPDTSDATDTEANNWLVNNISGDFRWDIDQRNEGSITLTSVGTFDTVSFENFAHLEGGAGRDVFDFDDNGSTTNGAVTGAFIGGDGTVQDEANFADVFSDVVIVLDGTSTSGVTFSGIENVVGNNDGAVEFGPHTTLMVASGTNDWTIDGVNEGDVDTETTDITFEGVDRLVGGTGRDEFNVIGTGFVTGSIDGGTNTDSAVRDEVDTQLANATAITVALDGSTFGHLNVSDVEDIQAAGNGNTLQASTTDQSTWTVDGSSSGNINDAILFSGFDILVGNALGNTFTITDTGSITEVQSGAGADQITVSGTVSTINTGDDGDSITINNASLTARIEAGNGGTATDLTDTLTIGYNAETLWNIDSGDETVQSQSTGGGTLTFTGIETAQGSDGGRDVFHISVDDVTTIEGLGGNDQFTIENVAALNLSISGGTSADDNDENDELVGADRANIWRIGGSVPEQANTLNYVSATERGVAFTGIESFKGDDDSDTLIVDRSVGTTIWTIDGLNQGTVTGIDGRFSAMENLTGGAATDAFIFDNATANITGLIDGAGAANDSLSVEELTSGVVIEVIEVGDTVTPTNPDTTNTLINLHVNNVESFTAAADADTDDAIDTEANNWLVSNLSGNYRWDIDARNEGEITLTSVGTLNPISFENFAHLEGGDGEDTFQFVDGGAVTGIFDGGGSANDQANFSNVNGLVDIVQNSATTQAINFTGIETVVGNHDGSEGETNTARLTVASGTTDWTIDEVNGGDVLSGSTDIDFSNFNQLQGGSGQDTFDIDEDGFVSGWIAGGTGTSTDRIDAGNANNTITAQEILLTTDTTTFGRLNIHDIERIQASGLNNTLHAALTGSNEWDVTSTNNGSLNATLAFEGFDTLVGNGATDNFVVRDGASIADINGAGGENTLTVESADDAVGEVLWSITAANTGQVTGRVTDFSNIDNLTGGEGADRFTFTQMTASIQGLIDGGEALLETDPSTDVLDVSIFVDGVVVELGPNAAPGSLVEDTAGLPNVNAHNMEEIVAAEGTPETEENNNWLAIASPSIVGDAPVLDWDWELDNATSELNEGQLQEIDNLIDLNPIENTQTLVFNFGSVQGGTGGENSNVIARNGNDDPDIYFNITGEYRPGSGDRALPYGDVDGLVVVDIDPRIIRVVGNANGEEGNNTLLRVASFDESNDLFDFNGVNNWTIDSENSGTFDNVDNDFSFEFTGVNQLQGGAGNDTFIFASNVDNATTGALVGGTINGGEGTNEIRVTTATGDLNFGVSTLQETSIDPDDIAVFFPELIDPVFLVNNRGGVIDFVGISRLLVTADNTTTLSSASTGDFRWTIGSLGSNSTLVNTGDSDTLTFSGVDRVVGGDANDTFNVLQLGIIDSVFDGGEGSDIVNLDAVSVDADGDDQALTLSLRTPPTENFDAIYLANIETLQALDRGHVLLADDVVNTWLIDNVNGGEIRFDNGDDQRLAFSNIAHLVGGGSQDIFNISEGGRLTGTIDGGDEIANPDRIDILSDATGAFIFQVSSRDADGSVVDTSANAIDILGVEQLNANNTSETIQHTLAAANGTNNTFAVGVTSFLFDGSVMLAFTGMDNLTGGDRGDQFIFNGAVVNGLVDGGVNLFDSEDSVQILNLTDGISVRLGDQRTDDLNVHNVETITATEPNRHRLIGDNNTNQWQVRGTNAGNVDGVSFSGFASLVGGSADDTFILARQDGADVDDNVSAIDGGANPATGSATDRIDLTGLIDSTTVAFDPNYDADLIVSNVERIEAIRNNHTLVGGDDVTQEWRITDVDAGEINNTEFTGFSRLLGRSQVDEFVFSESGNITGTVDGGSQPEGQRDVVDMRELEVSNVTIGDLESGFFDIEEYRGNNNNAVIRADDVRNEWEVSDANGGTILDINGNNITFSGFTDLEGGTDVDIFSLAGGSISGEIRAGDGNDRLEIDLGSGISGDVNFTGNDGEDRITIDGGDNETRFASNYSASVVDSVPHATLEYSISTANVANNYHVNFTDVETVNDRVFTNTMTINNVIGRDDIVTIANNRFGLDGFIDIDITNKNSLDIVGEQTDRVIIEGRVSLNDAFSVTNASVSGLDANAIIDANRMISFNTSGAIGSVDNRLSIETNNVSFNAVNGYVYVNQTGDLIIAQLSNPAAIIDIDATGTITDGADLSSANAIRLESDGTITLDNNNSLLGVVTLLAANGDVAFTNGTTRLGDVSAQNLSLTTTGNIDDEGLIQVANATTINGSATSVINLNGENNTFNNVTVTNAGSFFLNDSSANGVTVQGNASDNFIVQASNSITANAVSANAIELSSVNAGITIQNTVNAQNSVEISGEGVDINGSITVTSSVDSTADRAVLVDARTGDLNIRSAISADAGVLGDIELIGQTVQQFAGAVISGRNVFVDSDTDVNLAANITATEILDVNAGTEIVMDNGLTSTLTQAGTLTFTAVDNIVTQQIVADSVSLISTTGSIDQQGDITAGEISITANAGEFESQAGTVLSVNAGDLMVMAQGANIRGDIQANENAVTFDIDQSFLLSADISAANVNVETGAQITMTSGSQIDSSTDITFIAGSDIELSQLNAEGGTASLTAEGSITDNNGDASNISATSLFARSETGFGATADNANINTSVANIDVQNASGAIGIRNDQEVSITSLITNGNIRFVNTEGNVILSNMVEEDYDRDFNVSDARQAGGVINGNYSFGNVSILVSNGYLAAEPGANSNRPELVGDIIDVTTSNGFGFDRQLVVYAQTELIVSGPGIRPIWAFGEPPLFGLTTDSDLIDPSIVGGLSELLVEVEEAADIDPAIFTNVNNYLYDNISIRMPRDQIYDDDEYYGEEIDEDKEHDEGYYY